MDKVHITTFPGFASVSFLFFCFFFRQFLDNCKFLVPHAFKDL